ncbi:MAG: PPE domain-containing protein [Pseudonocardia sp.]|nr:PPE domain-containing protein [Pseudonocardia sp.]
MSAPNPLIVEAEHEDAQPLDNWEGAGATSSIADHNAAWSAEHPDPLQIAFTGAGAALDGLNAVMNPLDALATSAIGWLIEHVWWLHEPLDALAGDPTQITAQAQTWHNVATQLNTVAADYRAEIAGGAPDWDGGAADAYRAAAVDFSARLESASGMAERLSSVILLSGAGVATLRSWIRDQIAEFVWLVIQMLVWYGILAFLTAGGSLAAGAVHAVLRALELARTFARQISRLLDALADSGQAAHQLVEAMRGTVAQARAAAPPLRAANQTVQDSVAGPVIEAGKQVTNSGQAQRGWDGPAPV